MNAEERKVMELALEALEICYKDCYIPVRLTRESITAIKEALSTDVQAQPEQRNTSEHLEPVALMVYRGELCYKSQEDDQSYGMWCPVTQDLQFPESTKFYTTPPQRDSSATPRTWVGLTWEDANEIAITHDVRPSTVKAIEAKLKEKNT